MGDKIRNVLFICFGNTARSPAAEGIAKALKRDKCIEELHDVSFDSAGFFNVYKTAQPETKQYLKDNWDIDFSDFKGKIMDKDLLDKQDLILAMQSRHLKRLRRKFKDVDNLMDKAHLLLEFAGEEGDFDIEDPVNLTPGEYEQIIKTVEQGVIKSIEKIIEINSEK
ncbi:MAG: Low molecular weight protein-tyrosine-phosphatase YfkJ [Promethearchaeota archaeon]|jgi:protein-tyrosine-phosphatase|nr:MAG: Low molecular weight protein-tyrosine-phosphatase YfkJ [Candidatus Lokiarchaeota archaeon]